MAYPYELDYDERLRHGASEWLEPENWDSEDDDYDPLPGQLVHHLERPHHDAPLHWNSER
ncbi:hypothetical protein GCM10007860_15850 [Chitiniphilus shinanonensis]|uniref:Uncharacterized protein n=1 Tax=Chitiniphilus shinanonensis TaxID=553088 RepID=A0ABQ6BS43_9NEIS|nr:hypothetical protein [Chitiniphilus shinanonensis]GLS04438.1 hypothetical protein GCM10007860_15850 [Chitiniphilus shinanonensis]